VSRAHVKQTYRLEAGLVKLVEERARQRGVTKTDVVEAALASMLSPDHEERIEALLTRRLDRLFRAVERLEWHSELGNETLALFVRHWLTSTTPLPESALAAAQATGKRRWEGFVEALARRMDAGTRLSSELARDLPAARQSDPASK
jgi:hypothetical protein